VPLLHIHNLAKNFGSRAVLKNISLQIDCGEFITLLGESGSGKTTLLRLIAGFEQPTSGEILMNGAHLHTLPPYRRQVNTVFQNYALFPHLSVQDNVAYGLRVAGTPANEIPPRVESSLKMVKMHEYAAARPSRLSGGQQQRIALARALVNRPQLLLLDEPLSALDANLRKQVQSELKSLQRELGITFLFVTHDQEEAMALSDRIALLKDGALEQVASPREIYARPATSYTAQFIGQTNLLRAQIENGIATSGGLSWPTDLPNGSATFSLRPEAIRFCSGGSSDPCLFDPVGNPSSRPESSEQRISPPPGAIQFQANIVQQTFSGSTEHLELNHAGQTLRARIPARGTLTGTHNFFFESSDPIQVRD
jgi:ABC-type Fe3+/spermidine/putrescine transport system ATPase subunit